MLTERSQYYTLVPMASRGGSDRLSITRDKLAQRDVQRFPVSCGWKVMPVGCYFHLPSPCPGVVALMVGSSDVRLSRSSYLYYVLASPLSDRPYLNLRLLAHCC